MARRRRYRYARKGHGRRGSKAIPIAQTMVLAYPVVSSFKEMGFTPSALESSLFKLTGYSANTNKWIDPKVGIANAIALVALTVIGGKVASRVGANKLIKKATGGYLKLM